jgi:hypothetical protein
MSERAYSIEDVLMEPDGPDCCQFHIAGWKMLQAKYREHVSELAKLRAAKPEALRCVLCGEPMEGVMVGYGDGTGQRFVHQECYDAPVALRERVAEAVIAKAEGRTPSTEGGAK